MKKYGIVLIALFALLAAVPASAQNRIGFVAGLNLANVSVDPEIANVDYSSRAGFGFGGVFDLGLSENAVLHLEPMFLQKGSTLEGTGPFAGQEIKIKASYIEVPVLVKLALGTSTTRPYVMAGPTIGFLLSAKADDTDIKDTTKSTDFGLAFGAGVSFPAGNNSVFVEGRYALGLSDINDDATDDTKIKTKGIQFMAGVTFPLGQ